MLTDIRTEKLSHTQRERESRRASRGWGRVRGGEKKKKKNKVLRWAFWMLSEANF